MTENQTTFLAMLASIGVRRQRSVKISRRRLKRMVRKHLLGKGVPRREAYRAQVKLP